MWRSILAMHLVQRRSWQLVVGLFLATVWTISWWSQPTVAQVPQPSICQSRIVPSPIASRNNLPVVEVVKDLGIARTGPHDDCWRVTPLPRGTRARVVGQATGPDRFKKIVSWSRLDYGAWIESSELTPIAAGVPLQSRLDRVSTQVLPETTEISFPLSSPSPIEIQQGDRTLGLTFHNTVGSIQSLGEPSQKQNWPVNQTITFQNPVISRANWQQINPNTVQVNFQLKPRQQWGYQMRYVGNNLVLSLRQPPKLAGNIRQPLKGIRVVVDPGHGAVDSGAVGRAYGATYQEKTLNIDFSDLLQQELENRGAIVTMTRTTDVNPSLDDRQVIINQVAPAISISIHHDAGTPGRTRGASIYWYHPQSKDLAASLLGYFSRNGNRPILNNNGVIQRSFAVARPSGAPAVLLEVGFMTDPLEVTELAKPATQQRLAKVLTDGITQWVVNQAVS